MEKGLKYLEKLNISTIGFNPHLVTSCCGIKPRLIVNTEKKEVYAKCDCGNKYSFSELVTSRVYEELRKNRTGFGKSGNPSFAGVESNIFSPCCEEKIKNRYSYYFIIDGDFPYECDKCGEILLVNEVLTKTDMELKKKNRLNRRVFGLSSNSFVISDDNKSTSNKL